MTLYITVCHWNSLGYWGICRFLSSDIFGGFSEGRLGTGVQLFVAGMATRELTLGRFVGGMEGFENSRLAWPLGSWPLVRNYWCHSRTFVNSTHHPGAFVNGDGS